MQHKKDLIDIKTKLSTINDNVCKLVWKEKKSEDGLQREMEDCESYEQKLSTAISSMELRPIEESEHVERGEPYRNTLKLPQIPLPVFSNAKGESLEIFLNGFESIVNQSTLMQYQKFVYLEKQLKGEPLSLIKLLGTDERSYDAAKQLLIEAFASSINLKFDANQKNDKFEIGISGRALQIHK